MKTNQSLIIVLLTLILMGCSGTEITSPTPTHAVTSTPEPILTPSLTPTPAPFSFYFFINETEEVLNGNVYLNGEYLGKTQDGKIVLPVDKLFPGTVVLRGKYKGKSFEFQFKLKKKDLEQYTGMKYYVMEKDIKWLLFDISKLNWSLIEKRVFEFVNDKREEEGLKPLKWNEKVREVAYRHSKDMCERGYFAHENPEGEEHYDRLKKAGVYYIVASETLYLYPILNPEVNEVQIAKETVDGWLKSPGHRSVILDVDELYSDVGVGVFCCENKCYITLNAVGLEEENQVTLNRIYSIYYYLNDPGWGYNVPLTVSAEVTASDPVDIYIMPNKEEYEKFLKYEGFRQIKYVRNVKTFKETIKAETGMILVVYSNYYDNVDVKTKIRILNQ